MTTHSESDAEVNEDLSFEDGYSLSEGLVDRKKRVTRNAMGDYIPPPGKLPLTSLGASLPAPSDYLPKVDLTKPAAPQYSVAGPYKVKKGDYQASAAEYHTSLDMIWRDRTFAIKGKGKMRPYDITDDAHINDSIGPARYRFEFKNVGTNGPKWGLGVSHKINLGPPNKLVHPADTHGVDNPGPRYRPDSSYWGHGPKKSFGSSRKQSLPGPAGPGPAEYTITDTPRGPSFSLARRFPPAYKWQLGPGVGSPAANSYALGTTVGKNVAKSISGRPADAKFPTGPAPNIYTLPESIWDKPGASLTYRSFEANETPHPGPTQYSLTDRNMVKAPSHSISKKTRPCFPDILSYPLLTQRVSNPGPGKYEDHRELKNNDKPSFSIGKREKTKQNEVPGPNHYRVAGEARPDAKKAPAYSMGKRVGHKDSTVGPGPAAYYPEPTLKGSSGYSMTKRPPTKKSFVTPGPNEYQIKTCQTKKGVFMGPTITLKSRASPYVYSGIASNRIVEPIASADF